MSARTSPSASVRVPGDKSIAIRALLLASVARAPWQIVGLPHGDDVARALDAVRALGARVTSDGDAIGIAPAPLPAHVTLHAGESATLLRLAAGLLSTRRVHARIEMAPALSCRPHAGVLALLGALAGADVVTHEGDALVVRGRARTGAFDLETPDASAQQKSALLLAGLALEGRVTVRQHQATRAHTEEMLAALGARIERDPRVVTLHGPFEPPGAAVTIPGDPSSAALLALAVVADGAVRFQSLGVSAQRLGFFHAIERMGARVMLGAVTHGVCGPEADVSVEGAALAGLTLAAHEVSAGIDEIPALACACALARGPSRLCGLAALRGKESDRVQSTAALLHACGVGARIDGEDLVIDGRPAAFPAHARVSAARDHRIAMAALAFGRAVGIEVTLDDDACIAKSFPDFSAALDAVRAPH